MDDRPVGRSLLREQCGGWLGRVVLQRGEELACSARAEEMRKVQIARIWLAPQHRDQRGAVVLCHRPGHDRSQRGVVAQCKDLLTQRRVSDESASRSGTDSGSQRAEPVCRAMLLDRCQPGAVDELEQPARA